MTTSSSVAPASTTSRTSASSCPATRSSCSPGCPAPASPAWPSTRSSPRASAATSSRCPPYARQFLGQMDKPDVDFIEGLSPAVSIDQKSTNRNPRSTVGTITEVYDYLRLLFARAGRPHCPVCGEPITRQSPQQIVDRLLELPERTRFQVLAPVVRGRKGEYVDLFAELQTKGFARARVDGEVVALTEPPKLEKKLKHTIEVVVDRLVAKGADAVAKRRLTDSVETALGLAGGVARRRVRRPRPETTRTRAPVLREDGLPQRPPAAIDEIEPRSFSFNGPTAPARVHRHRHRARGRPRAVVPDDDLHPGRGCHRPVGAGLRLGRLLPRRHRRARPRTSASRWTRRGGRCRSGPRTRCSTARTTRCTSRTATASAASAPTPPGSRGSSRSSSAGTPRPTPTGAGSATRATCGRCPARVARAPA